MLQAPLLMVSYQVAAPMVLNTDAGDSALGIVLFHSTNVLRLMDPLADMVLGANLVTMAREGAPHCPFKGSQDCSSHFAVGIFILTFSSLDYIFSSVNIVAIHQVRLMLNSFLPHRCAWHSDGDPTTLAVVMRVCLFLSVSPRLYVPLRVSLCLSLALGVVVLHTRLAVRHDDWSRPGPWTIRRPRCTYWTATFVDTGCDEGSS